MDEDREKKEPRQRRNVVFPGSTPSFADSPLAAVWAKAADSRADAAETIARLREERRGSL
jgi:hypothetical protein